MDHLVSLDGIGPCIILFRLLRVGRRPVGLGLIRTARISGPNVPSCPNSVSHFSARTREVPQIAAHCHWDTGTCPRLGWCHSAMATAPRCAYRAGEHRRGARPPRSAPTCLLRRTRSLQDVVTPIQNDRSIVLSECAPCMPDALPEGGPRKFPLPAKDSRWGSRPVCPQLSVRRRENLATPQCPIPRAPQRQAPDIVCFKCALRMDHDAVGTG